MMNKKILLTVLFLMVPGIAQAAQTTLGQEMMDVGGGYQVPIAKPAPTILQSQVQASVPDGLDCANIDWRSQLRANLNTGMSMAEIKQVGQNALAASESYLMAALRPTYFETVQNILRESNFNLRASQASCHAIQAQLTKYDPLGIYAQKKQSEAIRKAAASGQSFDQAVASASTVSTDWSLDQNIAGSTLPADRKVALAATTGDAWVLDAGGSRKQSYSAPDSQTEGQVFKAAQKDAVAAITARFEGQTSCQQPLFTDPASQKRIAKVDKAAAKALSDAKPGYTPALKRTTVMADAAEQQLAGQNFGMIDCGAVQAWQAYTPEDRAIVLDVLGNHLALESMRLQLQQAQQDLESIKSANPDQSTLIAQVSAIHRLQGEFSTMQQNIEDQDAAQMAYVKAHKNAQKQAADMANQRLRYRDTQAPAAPTAPSLLKGW